MSIKQNYTQLAKILHWLIAGLIFSQYVLAELAENAEKQNHVVQQLGLLANHKSIGMTILALAILRLVWRAFNRPPPLPESMVSWQRRASEYAHVLLYLLIFSIPLTGWLMSSAKSYSVSWFHTLVFPDLVDPSEQLADTMYLLHDSLTKLLFILVVVHILAALKHQIFDRDEILKRMSGKASYLLMFISFAGALYFFAQVSAPVKAQSQPASQPAIEPSKQPSSQPTGEKQSEPVLPTPENSSASTSDLSQNAPALTTTSDAELPIEDAEASAVKAPSLVEQKPAQLNAWQIDYDASYIKFTGEQAGAPFTGEWQRWQAEMYFAEEQLSQSQFEVEIDIASVFSDDTSRDEYIVDPDFFDLQNHSNAAFTADDFAQISAAQFEAVGMLTMKGISKPTTLAFIIERGGDEQVTLIGSALLDRFEWNIGMGDWTDTTWVAKDVKVDVRVSATVTTREK